MAQQIFTSFCEPWDDASKNIIITWVSDSNNGVVNYSFDGVNFQPLTSFRSRAFPSLSGKWLHTALVTSSVSGVRVYCEWPEATYLRSFKMPPSQNARVAVLSDLQVSDYSPSSKFAAMAPIVTNDIPDMIIIAGDIVSDDGVINATTSQRWLDWLVGMETRYNRYQISVPMLTIVGNHEMQNYYTYPIETRGWGQMPTIFTAGFVPSQPRRFVNSAAHYSVGENLLVVTLDTTHGTLLSDQVTWFRQVMDQYAPQHRHVIVVGHAPTWGASASWDWDTWDNQARQLRYHFWPIMADHADKVRFYIAGHTHYLSVVGRRTTHYDPALTGAQNDLRFRKDFVGGVREIGCGPWTGTRGAVSPAKADEPSTMDGTHRVETYMSFASGSTLIKGDALNGDANMWHMWMCDFGPSSAKWRAIREGGIVIFDGAEFI